MSFLAVTIPVSMLVAVLLLALVIHVVRSGGFDDLEGPAARLIWDDDEAPELESRPALPEGDPEPGEAGGVGIPQAEG